MSMAGKRGAAGAKSGCDEKRPKPAHAKCAACLGLNFSQNHQMCAIHDEMYKLFGNIPVNLVKLATPAVRAQYAGRIHSLEAMCTYPLGSDAFKLDHGPDYFAFFDRQGDPTYYLLEREGTGQVLAQVAFVKRMVPTKHGLNPSQTASYVSDFKVHQEYRKSGLGSQLLARIILQHPADSVLRSCYGISMNAPGRANVVAGYVG